MAEDRRAELFCPGVVPFPVAWAWQQQRLEAKLARPAVPDALVLLEHPPVYTLGQGASLAHLRFDPGRPPLPLHRIERGGEVTYHGPGQLVGYAILDLHAHRCDLHWYLRQLEAVLIRALAAVDLMGERHPRHTGVWLAGGKVAAIGIKAKRWVTMHGFALNVSPDLTPFSAIVPCGLADQAVVSVAQFRPAVTVAEMIPRVSGAFAEVFGVEWLSEPLGQQAWVGAV